MCRPDSPAGGIRPVACRVHKAPSVVPSRGHLRDEDRRRLEDVVALSCLKPPGDTAAARLLKDGRAAPSAAPDMLAWLADALGIPVREQRGRLTDARQHARVALAAAADKGLEILTVFDPAYPELLKAIPDPPIVLYVDGTLAIDSGPTVAIVGSRDATPSGVAVAGRLARGLAQAGLVVVSGMARGIDGAAHSGALEAGGQTLAILGCGADVVYPPRHQELARRIQGHGAVLSELVPGTPPLPHHFPLRNRIISGLSRAVVVVEASERSGSLITARAALEQGRDVLAVPGGVASGRYRGCHALIKDGARLVETVEDILEEIGWVSSGPTALAGTNNSLQLSELEGRMAPGEPYSLDELVRETGRSVPTLLAELGHLELAGRLTRVSGGRFVRLD
jgi:DNA processing protein